MDNSREIQVSLAGKDQSFSLDALHGSLEITVIRLLVRDVSRLPCVQHCEHVLRICMERDISNKTQPVARDLASA